VSQAPQPSAGKLLPQVISTQQVFKLQPLSAHGASLAISDCEVMDIQPAGQVNEAEHILLWQHLPFWHTDDVQVRLAGAGFSPAAQPSW
jgi:hypothetical protein